MNKENFSWKLHLSLMIGSIGFLLLTWDFLLLYGGPPGAKCYTLLECVKKAYSDLIRQLPFYLYILVGYVTGFAFMIFVFLSPIGIFLAIKFLNSSKRKLAIFCIVLNSINLIFALFLVWAVVGLARGM
jgi:hypothetical protein